MLSTLTLVALVVMMVNFIISLDMKLTEAQQKRLDAIKRKLLSIHDPSVNRALQNAKLKILTAKNTLRPTETKTGRYKVSINGNNRYFNSRNEWNAIKNKYTRNFARNTWVLSKNKTN
jgi:hypothetical protein